MFCQILPRLNIERSTLREFPSPFCSVTTWPLRFPGAIEIRDGIHRRPFWHMDDAYGFIM